MQKEKDKKGNFPVNKAVLSVSVRGFLVPSFGDWDGPTLWDRELRCDCNPLCRGVHPGDRAPGFSRLPVLSADYKVSIDVLILSSSPSSIIFFYSIFPSLKVHLPTSKGCSNPTQLYNLESNFHKSREGVRSRVCAFTLPWLLHLPLDLPSLVITGLSSGPAAPSFRVNLVRGAAACLPHCHPQLPGTHGIAPQAFQAPPEQHLCTAHVNSPALSIS